MTRVCHSVGKMLTLRIHLFTTARKIHQVRLFDLLDGGSRPKTTWRRRQQSQRGLRLHLDSRECGHVIRHGQNVLAHKAHPQRVVGRLHHLLRMGTLSLHTTSRFLVYLADFIPFSYTTLSFPSSGPSTPPVAMPATPTTSPQINSSPPSNSAPSPVPWP